MLRRLHKQASGAAPAAGPVALRALRFPWFAWPLVGLLAACAVVHSKDQAGGPLPAPPAPGAGLLSHFAPLGELGEEPLRHRDLLARTEVLLTLEPPRQPDVDLREHSDETQERLRRRIEAYFERGLRFEDNQRIAAIELVGALSDAQQSHPRDILPTALAGLVLEDLAALGYDSDGGGYLPGDVTSLSELPVAMAHAHVPYAALAARAFELCADQALAAGELQVAALCQRHGRAMVLHAQQLPACTDGSVLAPDRQALPQPGPQAQEAGLLPLGAYGVPLLSDELERVIVAVHGQLKERSTLPLLPPPGDPASGGSEPGCAEGSLPSARLLASHPNARWYGLSLHCDATGTSCIVAVCGDGEAVCHSAQVDGRADDVTAWLRAARSLSPSSESLLLESSGEVANAVDVAIAVSDVRVFGAWPSAEQPARVLLSLQTSLLACQGDERYSGAWTVEVDKTGKLTGARGASARAPYLLDEAMAAGKDDACIGEVLKGLQFSAMKGVSARRVMFQLDIPARLQVDVPFSLRKNEVLGALALPIRLGRDGLALKVARCAALASPPLSEVGVCLSIAPSGTIRQLLVDPGPGHLSRPLSAPQGAASGVESTTVGELQECLTEALSQFDWGCRDSGPDGHASLTFFLPRGLLGRF